MLDDIIEAGIDILGDILEAVISSSRSKKRKLSKPAPKKNPRQSDPWEHSDKPAPWEK